MGVSDQVNMAFPYITQIEAEPKENPRSPGWLKCVGHQARLLIYSGQGPPETFIPTQNLLIDLDTFSPGSSPVFPQHPALMSTTVSLKLCHPCFCNRLYYW